MKKILILIIFYLSNFITYSFDSLLFKPLIANHLESRIGTFYQPNAEKLRLDIGHSLDLMQLLEGTNYNLRVGGDFFILSRLRSEGKFKFPVETSDFFFGLNLTGKWNNYSFRMRISHISSHLVDGYIKNGEFIQPPFVYSREFVNLIFAYNTKYIRPYIGLTSIFSTIPNDVGKFVPQVGVDFSNYLFKRFYIIGGYDFKLEKVNENKNYTGCNAAQIGLKYKLSQNAGLAFNFYCYSGNSIHGMFYNVKEKYTGFGIQFEY